MSVGKPGVDLRCSFQREPPVDGERQDSGPGPRGQLIQIPGTGSNTTALHNCEIPCWTANSPDQPRPNPAGYGAVTMTDALTKMLRPLPALLRNGFLCASGRGISSVVRAECTGDQWPGSGQFLDPVGPGVGASGAQVHHRGNLQLREPVSEGRGAGVSAGLEGAADGDVVG